MVTVGLLALTCARLAHEGASLVRGQDAGRRQAQVPARPRSGSIVTLSNLSVDGRDQHVRTPVAQEIDRW